MSQETENFDSLRRLIAIKRYEIPPPGYFDGFSREVIVRIKAGEQGQDTHGYVWQMGWLQRLWAAFEARPALAGGLGLALCALMVFGVVSADSDRTDLQPVAGVTPEQMGNPAAVQVANSGSSDQPMGVRPVSMEGSDRGGLLTMINLNSREAQPSLFDLVPPQASPASYHLSGPGSGN